MTARTLRGSADEEARLLAAKDAVIEAAVQAAGEQRSLDGGHPTAGPEFAAYLRHYYRHVAPDDLTGVNAGDVLGAAVSHRLLAQHRVPGQARVRVHTPEVARDGWGVGRTVVEVVVDDMPFLVDSVSAAINRQGYSIHQVVHPQLLAERSVLGDLRVLRPAPAAVVAAADSLPDSELAEPAPADGSAEGVAPVVESWMHLQIDRLAEPRQHEALAAALMSVLSDVREAVEDWQRMREAATRLAAEIESDPGVATAMRASATDPGSRDVWDHDAENPAEAAALLRWLAADHFTFLGYREYDLRGEGEDLQLVPVPATGLGVLRADATHSTGFARLPAQVRALAVEPRLLVLTKANRVSTVHRPAYLDYVGVKRFDADGRVVGERRFIGLLTAAAYSERLMAIPVVRRRAMAVLARGGYPEDSHSARSLVAILESLPRDELLQSDTDTLQTTATGVMRMQQRRRLRLFVRSDRWGRFASCLVYLPRDRYTTAVRLRMQQILTDAFGGESVQYAAQVSESVLARVHLVVRTDPNDDHLVDLDAVEAALSAATHTWDDEFSEQVQELAGEARAPWLLRRYSQAFPAGYTEDRTPRQAVADLERIEALTGPEDLGMELSRPLGAGPGERRFTLYRPAHPLSLSDVLPVLQHMGVEVVDERPYEIEPVGAPPVYVYDFGLRHAVATLPGVSGRVPGAGDGSDPGDVDADVAGPAAHELADAFRDAFAAVWRGRAENDALNGLVMAAGLTWRDVVVLRAYVRYLRQGGWTYSLPYVARVLVAHPDVARDLVALFATRFDPDRGEAADRTQAEEALVTRLTAALDAVASLDEDRILRSLMASIRATLRTNWYRQGPPTRPGGPPTGPAAIALKLDPRSVPDLPAPRPHMEVWVHSPRVEGVHLRFGAVARGGLRWSDRPEDFRTEILGLVKAQMVKNAVIVPVGAKGGFVVRHPPTDRDAAAAEGVECYRTFVRSLLDVTDNLAGEAGARRVVPPDRVVRHDGDDPYLVVAADKGTARFSDIANAVAAEYGFWLGDAFASGGSAGYDHKAMGITARGAWESVKRHFRELGVDVQRQDVTVVGIGDMSGDVFGNGMLLSRHIRLVAAFDHRHVFLDPDPDPEASFDERARLFALPRSSWGDYDRSLISAGGGVYPRSAKSVPITPQVRARLGLADDVTALTPADLVRACLLAPVDLLWNGGIGTYVKGADEPHEAAGDKANDAVRVDGGRLRCKVVGEGGNLGFTQRGRVEFALAGGRINTDSIDNSAGVDTSDHEVNVKILLDAVVAAGDLTRKQRDRVLAAATDEVAALVLRDNYEQNAALGNARQVGLNALPPHRRFVRHLERSGRLDRALEALPTERQLDARVAANVGLTSPEFSVLLAYAKIVLAEEVLASGLPDEPYLQAALREAFPPSIVDTFGDRLAAHPLRREIITTVVVNDLVNRAGITYAFRVLEEEGADGPTVARAYVAVRDVFGLRGLWAEVADLDGTLSTEVQTGLLLESRRLVDRGTRWFLHHRRQPLDVAAAVARFAGPVAELTPVVPGLLRGTERARLDTRVAELVAQGVSTATALRAAALMDTYSLLDVVELAADTGWPAVEVARTYFAMSERFSIDRMLNRVSALPRPDRWHVMARGALRHDLYDALAALTRDAMAAMPAGEGDGTAGAAPARAALDLADLSDEAAGRARADARVAAWLAQDPQGTARAVRLLGEAAAADTADLATLSVMLQQVRSLRRRDGGGRPATAGLR